MKAAWHALYSSYDDLLGNLTKVLGELVEWRKKKFSSAFHQIKYLKKQLIELTAKQEILLKSRAIHTISGDIEKQ